MVAALSTVNFDEFYFARFLVLSFLFIYFFFFLSNRVRSLVPSGSTSKYYPPFSIQHNGLIFVTFVGRFSFQALKGSPYTH
ncbi:hypothetical protein PUN28_018927 [Cardiocondyla obscurior]|uniref:ATP synthase F0 subunit 8 n=1 Tax=Cardiocondyla obscurior TaxID=286306 RepID=A0AAW2EIH6_9HYME